MGSNMNFREFGNEPLENGGGGGGGGRPPGNNQLVRQSSIYSLTFDELQMTMGGSLGKDFGSLNMDELLKNIWSAEEFQSMNSVGGGGASGAVTVAAQSGAGAAPLQRQGSLTLPRTLSQKTVDEVWKNISKEGNGAVGASVPQRQQTLGEMTLEEFLVRAGVVREDNNNNNNNNNQLGGKQPPNVVGFFGNNINNASLGIGAGLMSNRIVETCNNQIPIQAANLPLNVNGVRSNQQQQIFPKQPAMGYASQMPLQTGANQMGSPVVRSGIMGISDHGGLVQGGGGGGMGMVGLGAGAVTMASGSPANQISSDGMKSNGDTSSVSPVPFVFNGGLRGRKCSGAVEKVAERRQRRMIKNRESAARSRARKQAYTMELEAEVAKLKEENEELKKKQEEMVEMQKNQAMEMMNMQRGAKKRCLRRTQTGPW